MNATKIEWTDYTWNPVTGCLNNCSYCYARRIAERFRGTKAWPNGFEPTLHEDRIDLWQYNKRIPRDSKVFVCSMGELFGDWVPAEWTSMVLEELWKLPDVTFQFLTKCPENLAQWNPWPENAWVGVTATDLWSYRNAIIGLTVVAAPIRYISFEPLLHRIPVSSPSPYSLDATEIDWLIIGAQTNPYRPPEKAWVQEILAAADRSGVAVFIKDNLHWPEQRRE